jgi:hypothetical protein
MVLQSSLSLYATLISLNYIINTGIYCSGFGVEIGVASGAVAAPGPLSVNPTALS